MPVLMIFKWKGDADALVAAYDKEFEHAVARDQPGRLSHVCARAEDGMVIVDVWESEDAYEGMMADPEFQRLLTDTPTPAAEVLEVYEVHSAIP